MIKDKKGQALVEYILIIALVSVLAIALVNYLGGYLTDAITKSTCSVYDQVFVEGEEPGEGKCVDKDKVDKDEEKK